MQFQKAQWKKKIMAHNSAKADQQQQSKIRLLKIQRQIFCPQLTPFQLGITAHFTLFRESCSLQAVVLCKYECTAEELSFFSLNSLNFMEFKDRPSAAFRAPWI